MPFVFQTVCKLSCMVNNAPFIWMSWSNQGDAISHSFSLVYQSEAESNLLVVRGVRRRCGCNRLYDWLLGRIWGCAAREGMHGGIYTHGAQDHGYGCTNSYNNALACKKAGCRWLGTFLAHNPVFHILLFQFRCKEQISDTVRLLT